MAMIRVTTLVVVSLILVASIQLPKANADHRKDCSETCKEQCVKIINSNPFSCTTTCNNLCDPNAASGRRSLLRPTRASRGHLVDRIRGRPNLDWIKT